jgi:hypothetical protein
LVRQKIKEKENKGKGNDSFLKKMVLDVGRLLDCAGFGCWNLFWHFFIFRLFAEKKKAR